ncbi:RNA polymerase II subunit Rpb4 [Encephalitozoon hellem]|uniref:DNA-directed RNA polymerase II fourth largest subunit n=1 Tax=Encephalitozoon hellem TaxID=27973 RepID=A0A9Q9C721_ENCHE|nr:RNA polymerase II subunit Rpb4 [Encephalitozoon hellem ATCC 50504]AFM98775.1 RNA polymerase II subunit Rpb4 [Encephalitozoon hellem ATCC 50504]KAG5860501.1 RNA polymerase II subunit Rpb4 [Encephalitozoon hellem]UTX43752.1 DNA-directed RNA polymerase II subunit RPB4 [Encephalitozoon hellem]WEL39230.1 DNA-directed RNA polymerase II fourth largest subunit [Encephalitozoon hellem]|eukprot:XP_003887756.1 RNA polymerase II subunit Rpb4 [Encephalitozoon hellem ATCC 50504]
MDSDKCDEDMKDSHPVTLAEARYLLEGQKERFRADFRSNASKIFRSTLGYLDEFCRIKDKSVAEDLRTTLSALGFSELEIALFGSLFPQSVEEAKSLVPSLESKGDDVVEQAVEKIQQLAL